MALCTIFQLYQWSSQFILPGCNTLPSRTYAMPKFTSTLTHKSALDIHFATEIKVCLHEYSRMMLTSSESNAC